MTGIIKTGSKERTLECPRITDIGRICFSANNKFVIFSSSQEIHIWDLDNDLYTKEKIVSGLDQAISSGYSTECINSNAKLFQMEVVSHDFGTKWIDEKRQCLYSYPSDIQSHVILKTNTILGSDSHRLEMLKMEGSFTELEHLKATEPIDFWNEIIPKMTPLTQIDQFTFSILNSENHNPTPNRKRDNPKEPLPTISNENINDDISNTCTEQITITIADNDYTIDTLIKAAEILEKKKDYSNALILYQIIENVIEENFLDEKLLMAISLFGQGRVLMQQKIFDEALKKAEMASIFSSDIDENTAIKISELIKMLKKKTKKPLWKRIFSIFLFAKGAKSK